MSWEVRTMPSVRSWFNPTLFKKNLTRFWPIWGLYLAIWVVVYPLNLVLDRYLSVRDFADYSVLNGIIGLGLPMAVCFSILAAMAVWSYLYNSRSVCLMHTLPIRREGLFLTNYLSGLTFFVLPNLAVFLLTLLAEGVRGAVNVGALCMWLVSVTLMELFFFSFATFCAMFTGHILCLPAFYAILNVLVAGVVWLLDAALSQFVFGYTGVQGLWRAVEWLTPVWKLGISGNIYVRAYVDAAPWLVGLGYILIYAFIGLVLAALALVAYRRREMERAGDVVTVTWVRPVFLYGVAFCCALAFGTLFYNMFQYTLPEGAWTLLIFMLLCGAAGYFIARMLLEKSFRVFHAWKGCAVFLCALVALTCVMEFDLTGFERRVPDPGRVVSVSVTSNNSRPYDSGDYFSFLSEDEQIIQAVTALHRAVADNKNDLENGAWGGGWTESDLGYNIQLSDTNGFRVTYVLDNGHTMSRDYSYCIPVTQQLLDDPDSPAALQEALLNLPQVRQQMYGLSDVETEQVLGIELTYYTVEDGYQSVSIRGEDMDTLFEAVQADLAEGGLGRRYLLDNEERMNTCYVNDLEIGISPREERTEGPEDSMAYSTVRVGLQTTARHTIAALEEMGVLEGDVRLLTHAQVEQANQMYAENGDSWESMDPFG